MWAPHSPDLSPPDFFLWGYLKDRVYKNRPRSIADLKNEIRREIGAITPQMRRNVMQSFRKRIDACIERNRGHLEHVIKRAGHQISIVDKPYCYIYHYLCSMLLIFELLTY